MLRSIASAALIAAVVVFSGCASVPMASAEADAAAKSYKINPKKANVYVYRNENFGGAVKMPVLIDNMAVGDTAAKTYIFKQVDPGSRIITSKTENDATLTIDAKPGKNYFVWQEVKMGAFSAGSKLHLVDESTGKAGVETCKLVQ
jgi:PBP1b-binding outer membrane lipoprotein LpoB